MIIDLKKCNVIKNIKEDNNKKVSIIENNGIKFILKQAINNDLVAINMLKNEVNALSLLQNENFVPKLVAYQFDDNNNYVITEYIDGKNIKTLDKLNIREKIIVMIDVAKTVSKLHSKSIIHCDLKPSNILLGIDKKIRIIDFGISIYSNNKYFTDYGTVGYCSVQQLLKKDIDYNTDLYSLGIIFYELLFNKLPFNGSKEEVKTKKLQMDFEKCDNDLFNFIFFKLFCAFDEVKYNNLNDFINDLKLLLLIYE